MIEDERGRRGGLIYASGQVGLWEGCWEIKDRAKGWMLGDRDQVVKSAQLFLDFIKGIFVDLLLLYRAVNFSVL